MSWADWIIFALLLLNVVSAAIQGFFAEALSMAGLIVGYIVAAWQYPRLAGWLSSFFKSEWLADIFGFLIIFFVIVLLFGIAGRIARWVMKESGLRFVDRLLGGALGLLRGCLIVAVVVVSMTAFTPASKWLAGSEWAPYFQAVGRAAIWVAPAELRARFYQGLDLLHHMPQSVPGGAAPQTPGK